MQHLFAHQDQQLTDQELARLKKIAWRMDALFFIPGTNLSVGLDNIVGLVPVVGDVATIAPSVYIVWRARQLGATPGALAYMIGNVVLDVLIGSIPVVGDLYDVWWNANIRNVRLLEKNLARKAQKARSVVEVPPLLPTVA